MLENEVKYTMTQTSAPTKKCPQPGKFQSRLRCTERSKKFTCGGSAMIHFSGNLVKEITNEKEFVLDMENASVMNHTNYDQLVSHKL